jgi:hypothetical protein
VYKVIHLLGILMLFLSFGGLITHAINGGTKATNTWRTPVAITHGIGLLLALVGGFGLLARFGIGWPWPGWVIAKLIIWLIFAAVVGMAARRPTMGKTLWWLLLILGGIAAYLAGAKPF